jgi:hypothetical protein
VLSNALAFDATIAVETRRKRLIGRDRPSRCRFVTARILSARKLRFYTQICTHFLVNVGKRSRASLTLWCDHCIRVNYL